MAAPATGTMEVYQDALANYLVSMARTVEVSLDRALLAVRTLDPRLARAVFMAEPRLNEMEMIIDEHAVKLLRSQDLSEEHIRQMLPP